MRRRNTSLKVVKELDAFPKLGDSYVEPSTSGAAISIVAYILIGTLVYMEFRYFMQSKISFKYDVDTDYDSKLKINVDVTVAMPCDTIGADILDVTNENNVDSFGVLEEEPTWFELTPAQRQHWDSMAQVNNYIQQQFFSLQDVLWKSGHRSSFHDMPARNIKLDTEPDACRLHGTLLVNKVAGNFHITAGKSLPNFGGHAHLSVFLQESDYNFSHRINQFSFGEQAAGIIDPLDGEEKIASTNFQIYHYFVQVVPTVVKTFVSNADTYQFAVTEQEREINHDKGSHGIPGIFFKYDMSSIKVIVREEHEALIHFLVRMCGIVGGIFATSGIINIIVGWIVDVICCRHKCSKNNDNMDSITMHDNEDQHVPMTHDTVNIDNHLNEKKEIHGKNDESVPEVLET